MKGLAGLTAGADLWVFGYGSLMWRPGFEHVEMRRATLVGYRRCFCIYSTHHRGTAARPGLVLGLDRGGACHGIAYRVPAAAAARTLRYLQAREQVNGVYRETHVPVLLEGAKGREVFALTYIVERAHPSYAGRLSLDEQACLIRGARGISGPNLDYLISTLTHLAGMGLREAELERLLAKIGPHFASGVRDGCPNARSAALLKACRGIGVQAPRLKPGDRRRFIYRRQISMWHSPSSAGQ